MLPRSLRRFAPATLTLALVGLTGCLDRTYRYVVTVDLSSQTDVSVPVEDVLVGIQVTAVNTCTTTDLMYGDEIGCDPGPADVTSILVGPEGAAAPLPSDGVLRDYKGGPYEIDVMINGDLLQYKETFPSVFSFTVEPAPLVLDEPFTMRWEPHGQPGISACLSLDTPQEETVYYDYVSDEGVREVTPFLEHYDPGTYKLNLNRSIGCMDAPIWVNQNDADWSIRAEVVRSMTVVHPLGQP